MILTQIKVPDFRVLKNIELNFDKNFPKKIFPIGSLNGGGKSTLLQLIFILLHCSTNKNRIIYIKNLLKGYASKNKSKNEILFLDLNDAENNITAQISFYACNSLFLDPLKEKLDKEYLKYLSFSTVPLIEEQNNKIEILENNLDKLNSLIESIKTIENTEDSEDKGSELRRLRNKLRDENFLPSVFLTEKSGHYFRDLIEFPVREKEFNLKRIKGFIEREISEHNAKLKKLKAEYEAYSYSSHEIMEYIKEQNLLFLTTISENDSTENGLLCSIKTNLDYSIEEKYKLLDSISNRIFLAAPSTQVFLFLSADQKRMLLKKNTKNKNQNYFSVLDEVKEKLDGLFTYDFLALDYILESFKKAKEADWKEAVESDGDYGKNYKNLLKSINQILSDKTLSSNVEVTGVSFKLINGTPELILDKSTQELLPEDLSHGELKRLSIFMWLKYKDIKNSIVLMDEIEIAFHPDWQFQIANDLIEWGPDNQYILATHSYELCNAVTPKHVKDLTSFKNTMENYGH